MGLLDFVHVKLLVNCDRLGNRGNATGASSGGATAGTGADWAWATKASTIRGSIFRNMNRRIVSLISNWRRSPANCSGSRLKIDQPVRALALSLDGIGQAALFPEAADEDLAAGLLDQIGQLARNAVRIAAETGRVQDKHRFVDVAGQN